MQELESIVTCKTCASNKWIYKLLKGNEDLGVYCSNCESKINYDTQVIVQKVSSGL